MFSESGGERSRPEEKIETIGKIETIETIKALEASDSPVIRLVKKLPAEPSSIGVFASSFNPVTVAHMELMTRARARFALDEVLALASVANADKTSYECGLANRLEMLELAVDAAKGVSIGVSSTGFFVDMISALKAVYPNGPGIHFITGFDTLVRILDADGKYVSRYYNRFNDRREVLEYLLKNSRVIVAERSGYGESHLKEILEREHSISPDRVLFMPFPADFSDRSSSQVRGRVQAGESISDLVAPGVGQYIREHGLYLSR
ncbi:MAG TPA: nicotinate-nicotinamide nucleotide adenylyltransferase [Blastocatellia bacterium]|nr:nicotinate-nicotinamide nucleotide adenylyltransferase [Blastocatellia bacterium]